MDRQATDPLGAATDPDAGIERELRDLEAQLFAAILHHGSIGQSPDGLLLMRLLMRLLSTMRALRRVLDRYRGSAEELSPSVLALFAAALDPIRLLIEAFGGDEAEASSGSTTAH